MTITVTQGASEVVVPRLRSHRRVADDAGFDRVRRVRRRDRDRDGDRRRARADRRLRRLRRHEGREGAGRRFAARDGRHGPRQRLHGDGNRRYDGRGRIGLRRITGTGGSSTASCGTTVGTRPAPVTPPTTLANCVDLDQNDRRPRLRSRRGHQQPDHLQRRGQPRRAVAGDRRVALPQRRRRP